jgi:hypothetical protein
MEIERHRIGKHFSNMLQQRMEKELEAAGVKRRVVLEAARPEKTLALIALHLSPW